MNHPPPLLTRSLSTARARSAAPEGLQPSLIQPSGTRQLNSHNNWVPRYHRKTYHPAQPVTTTEQPPRLELPRQKTYRSAIRVPPTEPPQPEGKPSPRASPCFGQPPALNTEASHAPTTPLAPPARALLSHSTGSRVHGVPDHASSVSATRRIQWGQSLPAIDGGNRAAKGVKLPQSPFRCLQPR
jgi:hypothetical protein